MCVSRSKQREAWAGAQLQKLGGQAHHRARWRWALVSNAWRAQRMVEENQDENQGKTPVGTLASEQQKRAKQAPVGRTTMPKCVLRLDQQQTTPVGSYFWCSQQQKRLTSTPPGHRAVAPTGRAAAARREAQASGGIIVVHSHLLDNSARAASGAGAPWWRQHLVFPSRNGMTTRWNSVPCRAAASRAHVHPTGARPPRPPSRGVHMPAGMSPPCSA